MVKKSMYKIKYESAVSQTFSLPGKEYYYNEQGKLVGKQIIPQFVIKSGEEKSVDEKTFEYLKRCGALRSKEDMKKREKLQKKMKDQKYDRTYDIVKGPQSEKQKEVEALTDEERSLLLNDLPYEV